MTEIQQIEQLAGKMDQGQLLYAIERMLGILRQRTESTEEDRSWATPEFFSEMDRRIEEVRSGKVQAIPAEDFFTRLRTQFSS